MSLRSKIVVPFLLLFALEFVVVALLSASTAARSVESSIRRESEDLARVLGQAGFAPDRELLGKIKAIIGTDLARLDAAGGGLLSTLSQGDEAELLSRVGDALTEEERRGEGGSGSFDVALASGTRRAFYSPVESLRGSGKGSLLLLLLPVERIAGAKWDLVVPILLVAGAGALPVALVGVLLGMAITRPLRELSAAAARLAGGDLGDRVNVSGTDEIAALASSFNSMAEELERREAELLRSERLAVSGRLAAGVAHEIRNPLTAVRMSLQRAARAGEQGGALSADEAQVLLTEIERLEMIVDGLVAYARPGPPEFAEVDLCGLVSDLVRLMARQFEHAHVDLRCNLPEEGIRVMADSAKLKQVIMNLILNAMEAMPGGGRLSIVAAAEGDEVLLEVSDEGRGVAEEIRGTIFEPFVSAREGGTGLGLAVSKQVVEEHSGRITFESSPASTTFRVALPVGKVGA